MLGFVKFVLLTCSIWISKFLFRYIHCIEIQCLESFLVYSVAGDVTNIILDPILMFACRLGVSGAAIAHVISQSVLSLFLKNFFFTSTFVFSGLQLRIMLCLLYMFPYMECIGMLLCLFIIVIELLFLQVPNFTNNVIEINEKSWGLAS